MDLTGCERVFGGLHNIVRKVTEALARMRIAHARRTGDLRVLEAAVAQRRRGSASRT